MLSHSTRAEGTHSQTSVIDALLAEAQAHEQAGADDAAERVLATLIERAPDHAGGLHRAALVAFRRGRSQQATEWLERAIHSMPGQAPFHRDIGEMYRRMSRLDPARHHVTRAVELSPCDASAYYNLGVVLYDCMEIDAAIEAVRRALTLDPDMAAAHFQLSELLLLSGQFDEGWNEYEWRFRMPGVPPPLPPSDRPQWDGEPLQDGTLLLIADQGFGDTIQFSRYIPLVARLCANLVVACSAEMQPIVSQQAEGIACFDRWEHVPEFAAYCPMSGLPRLFGTTLDSIPAATPRLAAQPLFAAHWRERLAQLVSPSYRRIGLVWAGRPSHGNDFNRSVRLSQLASLADLEGIVLVSLQMGKARAEVGHHVGRAPLLNLGAEIRDFNDTMAILEQIDHLVTVDTSVAHLAGTMGIPTTILLPFAPDWRWSTVRSDSPWYPSVTLIRQTEPGQWASVVEKLIMQLDISAHQNQG
jgi:Tfp pilus assembly protein PilF